MVKQRRRQLAGPGKASSAQAPGGSPSTLADASPATRAAVLSDIHDVLQKHGLTQQVAELHLEPSIPPAASGPVTCPPGQILRQVCTRDAEGNLQCVEKCVDV